MVKGNVRRYLVSAGLVFAVFIAAGLFVYARFSNAVSRYNSSAKEMCGETVGDLHYEVLYSITEVIVNKFPILYDTDQLRQIEGSDWFWKITEELDKIADDFNLTRIYLIKKRGDGYAVLLATGIRRFLNPERIGGSAWEGKPPAFIDEAWDSKQFAVSPGPADEEGRQLILAARPLLAGGETVGILGIDYKDTHSGNCIQHLGLQLDEKKEDFLNGVRKYFFILAAVLLLLVLRSVWLIYGALRMTRQRQAEDDELTRHILEATPLICSVWDPYDGSMIDCNHEMMKILSAAYKEEFVRNYLDFSPEYQPNGAKSQDEIWRYIGEVMEIGYRRFEWMYRNRLGEQIPVDITIVRVPWKNGWRIVLYATDLREQKAKDAALQDSEERLRIMLDTIAIPCFFFSPGAELLDCNLQTIHLFGFESKQEFLEQFYNLSPEYQPDGRHSADAAREIVRRVYTTGKVEKFRWEHIKADGSPLPVEVTGMRVPWKDDYRIVAYNQDLSALVESEDKLHLVLAMVETSPNITVYLNADGNIEYMNPVTSGICGYSPEELSKDGMALMFSREDYERLKGNYLTVAIKHKSVKFDMTITAKNGRKFDFNFSAFSVKKHNGETGVGIIGRDITELKRMQRNLTSAKNQAELALASEIQYNKAKCNLLSRVSHELRTPLNAIAGMTGIAKKTSEKKVLNRCFVTIETATDNLLDLVNDIVDMTGFDTGNFDFLSRPFNLGNAVASVIDNITRRANEKKQIFVTDIDSSANDWVESDERRLKQVLMHLLSNAVKFTREYGRIEFSVRILENDGNDCTVRFEVIDNGIGISQEGLKRLWEIFEQEDSSITREYSGMGLGLSLTKRIVELMRGELSVESELGKGSRFTCVVRLGAAQGEGRYAGSLVGGNHLANYTFTDYPMMPDLTGKRIMIVDDVEINREILLMLLQNTGATLDEASNGDEAVKMFTQNPYDLILMDLHMPVMDGYTAATAIRSSDQKHARTAPIISVSAESGVDFRRRCEEAGITDHIEKPVEPEALSMVISTYLSG